MDDWIQKIFVSKDKNKKQEKREDRIKQDKMKRLLALSLNFNTKIDDEASVLGFFCHILKIQPLLPLSENLYLLDETSLVIKIKSNVFHYEESKVISKHKKLGEIIGYFTRNYLNNPNFRSLLFHPIYELSVPYNNKDAVKTLIQ